MKSTTSNIRLLKKQRLADGTVYQVGVIWYDCPDYKAERLIERGEAELVRPTPAKPAPVAPVGEPEEIKETKTAGKERK